MKELNNMKTEGTKLEFDPAEILRSVEVDPYAEIDKPPTGIEIHTGGKIAPSFTLGNFSMVIGKAKSKKTFLLTGLAAAVVSNSWALDRIKGTLPDNKRGVLYFDTEQSEYHLNRTIKRVLSQSVTLENFKAFGLRKFKPAERVKLIEFALYNTDNIGLVFIDGLRDLLSSINDEEQSTAITSDLLRWTAELNIHIVVVLHQNKGDMNARGHVGSEALNKGETTLSVTIDDFDKDISIVSCEFCRDLPFDNFAFRINEQGLPEGCELPEKAGAKPTTHPDLTPNDKHFLILNTVFKNNPNPKYRELWQAVKLAFAEQGLRFGENKAKDFVTYQINKGWISKNGLGYKYERAIF
jgi:hypothetical protein